MMATEGEKRTAQIASNLAQETQQANNQINSDFARSQQEFADQIASQFDASVSRDLDAFAVQQTERSIIGSAEAGFSTPRMQALAIPQSVQIAINDAAALNATQAGRRQAYFDPVQTSEVGAQNNVVGDSKFDATAVYSRYAAELGQFGDDLSARANFASEKYGEIARSDHSAIWFFLGEQVADAIAVAGQSLGVAKLLPGNQGELKEVFLAVNEAIYADVMTMRDAYQSGGVGGVRDAATTLYGDRDARYVTGAYESISALNDLATSQGISFREAASTAAGQALLHDAMQGFLYHEQGIVAEDQYRSTYGSSGRKGTSIVASAFDNSGMSLLTEYSPFGAVLIGNDAVGFSGRLSNRQDRLNFADQLSTSFTRNYTNDNSFGQMLELTRGDNAQTLQFRTQKMIDDIQDWGRRTLGK